VIVNELSCAVLAMDGPDAKPAAISAAV